MGSFLWEGAIRRDRCIITRNAALPTSNREHCLHRHDDPDRPACMSLKDKARNEDTGTTNNWPRSTRATESSMYNITLEVSLCPSQYCEIRHSPLLVSVPCSRSARHAPRALLITVIKNSYTRPRGANTVFNTYMLSVRAYGTKNPVVNPILVV